MKDKNDAAARERDALHELIAGMNDGELDKVNTFIKKLKSERAKHMNKYNHNGIKSEADREFAQQLTEDIRMKVCNAYELLCSGSEHMKAIPAELDAAFEMLYQVKVELDCIHGVESEQVQHMKKRCSSLFALCGGDED